VDIPFHITCIFSDGEWEARYFTTISWVEKKKPWTEKEIEKQEVPGQ
jgi:hypothetical protein